ncbi:MAG: sulfate ABC transporter permease subunit CysW [Lautropia sp.]|nr:sulfate ABC transporter permease subunit CysW [Lautropia sp.]
MKTLHTPYPRKPASTVQWLLLALGILIAVLLLVLPLVLIFAQVASGGWALLVENLSADYLHHALGLTLLATLATIPINLAFGLMFAWCVTHFRFRGRRLLIALIDIPYATSPVVAGLCYLLLYGAESALGQYLSEHDIQLMFAWPGIIMVTIFVTSPYVARLLMPLMQTQGDEEEQAALLLGASGWQIFWKVSLPKIRWALLYGVVITNARAVGEFGAVSVVSGATINQTLTLPLLVEQLNNDYKTAAAFTAASLLALMALLTLVLKTWLEKRQAHGGHAGQRRA